VDCLDDALRERGKPEVFNSDQGAPFTGKAYTDYLLSSNQGQHQACAAARKATIIGRMTCAGNMFNKQF
jgi:hypothetical protein